MPYSDTYSSNNRALGIVCSERQPLAVLTSLVGRLWSLKLAKCVKLCAKSTKHNEESDHFYHYLGLSPLKSKWRNIDSIIDNVT